MRRLGLVLLVAGLLLPAANLFAGPVVADGQKETDRLKTLVAQLGSPRFLERQEATRFLDQAGEPALPLLRTAMTSPDLEVRTRAEALIARIEMKRDTARALLPSRVSYKCNDVTVTQAISEFATQTGHPIQLTGDLSQLSNRRITLDTGDTTFWDAFNQLCAKAGIREAETPADQPANPNQMYYRRAFNGRMARVAVWNGNGMYNPQQNMLVDSTLLVEDGAAPKYASVAAGSMRVRALPPKGGVFTDLPDGNKQIAMQMEVKPEARLEVTQFIGLRIERVLDDAGHNVRHTGDYIDAGFPQNMYGDVVFMGMDDFGQMPSNTSLRNIPISFVVGNKGVQSLRELSGTICARVRTAPEPFVTVDNLAKAVGRTSKGPDGSEIKIAECKRDTDGLCQVKIELKTPLNSQMDEQMAQMANLGLMQLRRGVQVEQPNIQLNKNDPNSVPFKVLNAKGEVMELVTGNLQVLANNDSARVFTLVYKPTNKDDEPTKLEYIGRREVLVEVPFTLKDVQLMGKDRK
jgi:hypothetical protein